MKSIPLRIAALIPALMLATDVLGQVSTGQILSRGQAAALKVDAGGDQIQDQPGGSGFPVFSASRARDASRDGDAVTGMGEHELAGPAITVTSSLVVVLGLFAGMIWLTRRFGSRGMSHGVIPKEVIQNLGSTPMDARTTISMIRCGNRILVIARATTGIHPLAEIADPDEVREISAACLGDSKQAFASALKSIEQETAKPGYLGAQTGSPTPRSRGRLFATA